MNAASLPRVSLAELESFLRARVAPELHSAMLMALHEPMRIPTSFPGPKQGGGANNHDQVMRACVRYILCRNAGNEALAKNALEYARAWMRAIRETARDPEHRYLEGARLFLDIAHAETRLGDMRLAHEVLAGQGKLTLHNDLTRFVRKDFANVRGVTRSIANVAVYVEHLRDYNQESADIAAGLEAIRNAVGWFYGLTSDRNPALNAGELPGWAVDPAGVPYQVDEIGKEHNQWRKAHNVFHNPFVAFYIQHAAMHTLRRTVWEDLPDRLQQLVDRRQSELERWFWAKGYASSADPFQAGLGPTRPIETLSIVPDEPSRLSGVVAPTWFGYSVGNMLYPYWRYLFALPRGGEFKVAAGRMLNAFVAQTVKHWRAELPLMLFSPSLLELVVRAPELETELGDPPAEPPTPEPKPRALKERLKAGVELLREDGSPDLANLLLNAARAVRDFRRDQKGLN